MRDHEETQEEFVDDLTYVSESAPSPLEETSPSHQEASSQHRDAERRYSSVYPMRDKRAPQSYREQPQRRNTMPPQRIENTERNDASSASSARLQSDFTRAITQHIGEGVYALDADGLLTFMNPAAERLLGWSEAELLGREMHEIIHFKHANGDPFPITECPLLSVTRLQTLIHIEDDVFVRKDGSFLPVAYTSSPIISDGQPLGAVLAFHDISARKRDEEERVRLLEREREARRKAEAATEQFRALQSVTDIALTQLTLDDLLRKILDRICITLHGDSAAIMLLAPDGRHLVVRAALGLDEAVLRERPLPIGRGIGGRIASQRQPVVIKDITTVEVASVVLRANTQSLVGAPLMVEDNLIGIVHVGASRIAQFSQDDAQFLLLAAGRIAQSIEQARLYEAERQARAAAEAAQARLAFLAEASAVLASSLEYTTTLTHIVHLATPLLADCCYVDILEDDGTSIQRLAIAHRDPQIQQRLEEIRRKYPLTENTYHPIHRILRTGQPLLIPVVTEAEIATLTADPVAQQTLAAPGFTSYLSVPLKARGRTFGALTLANSTTERRFDAVDLALAEELARRAATAIDNALLHYETRHAMSRVEEIALQLGQQASELDTIIEAIPDGVYVCDEHGAITHLNRNGAALFGMRVEQMLGPSDRFLTAASLHNLDGRPTPLDQYPLTRALLGETRTDLRYLVRRVDTSEKTPIQVSFAPIRTQDGRIVGGVAVASEISRLYQLERQKDEFLSIASHELKTPLTSLKMLTQLTHRRLSRAGNPEAEHTLRMERSIVRMERLVNDLLDASRIESGKLALRREQSDLAAICRQMAEEQIDAVERAIEIDLPAKPVEVIIDPERMGQVITNLLTNALKYSPPNQPVNLRLRKTEHNALLSVHDVGGGIPPEALPHLFERFYRVPGVQVQSGSGVGLGLGLYISYEIVQRHGGHLWAESEVGKGSVFFVSLPLASEPPAAQSGEYKKLLN